MDDPPHEEYQKPFTMHYDLPLFIRRYPSDRDGILEDFQNGRPIILFEHHNLFKRTNVIDTVKWINSLGEIKWQSLSSIVAEICPKNTIQPSINKSARSNIKSVLRRVACEIRDNFIHTNPHLDKLYMKIRKWP